MVPVRPRSPLRKTLFVICSKKKMRVKKLLALGVLFLVAFILIGASTYPSAPAIYMFSGPTSPSSDTGFNNVFNANILTGVVMEIGWAQVQNGSSIGTYTWTALDSTLLGGYTSGTYSGLKIGLISAPASDTSINAGSPNDYTPSFVSGSNQAYCSCPSYYGDGSSACTFNAATQEGAPLPLDSSGGLTSTFYTYYIGGANAWIPALFTHVQASSYAGQIGYYVIGLSGGGESYPRCSSQIETALGISQATLIADWKTYISSATLAIATAMKSSGVTAPVYVTFACFGNTVPPSGYTTGNDCDLATSMAASSVTNGLGIRVTTPRNIDYALLAGGVPTTSDWGAIVLQNKGTAIDWQQGGVSDPSASATSTGTNCSPTSQTGSLAQLIPFMMQHIPPGPNQRIMEIYTQDLERNYGTSGPNVDNCWTNGNVGAYTSTFNQVLFGTPIGTSTTQGTTIQQGTTLLQ